MGASEDRFNLQEWERQARANNVQEIMVPGHGIWTKDGLKALLDDDQRRKRQLERQADEERRAYLEDQDR